MCAFIIFVKCNFAQYRGWDSSFSYTIRFLGQEALSYWMSNVRREGVDDVGSLSSLL